MTESEYKKSTVIWNTVSYKVFNDMVERTIVMAEHHKKDGKKYFLLDMNGCNYKEALFITLFEKGFILDNCEYYLRIYLDGVQGLTNGI